MAAAYSQPPRSGSPGGLPELSSDTKSARYKANKISSTILADLKFERKNKPHPRLPPNHTIQKRPINHPPIASPYAGPDVQKVVYVSKNTPIMAAVKRVKKLLEQAEKRNLQREGILGNGKSARNIAVAAQNKNQTKQEVVLVKGSGRAIEQATKVGEWFKRHAEDGEGGWVVNVKAKSVKVIDDIVEDAAASADGTHTAHDHNDDNSRRHESIPDLVEGNSIGRQEKNGSNQPENGGNQSLEDNLSSQTARDAPKQKQRRPKKRKRPIYAEDKIPEARTRFINAIEIAVSIKR
jgi:ribonuclease P/MRP protein subunit POP7